MGRRVLTVPNFISFVRLLCIPLFLWLLFGADERTAAFVLLGFLGATDWVDGWIARRYHQESELGKILDPVADRAVLLTAAIALTADGVVPLWVGVAVLAREAAISIVTLALAAAGARRIDVQWVGKAGAFFLFFAFPGFLWVDTLSPGSFRDLVSFATWVVTILGLVLSYYAAFTYIPLARRALREGQADRARQSEGSGAAA
jgi:cardiolipin synthase (CMP-forming)